MIIFFLVILAYKIISNLYNFIYLAYISDKYEKFIKNECSYFSVFIPSFNKLIDKSGFKHYMMYVDLFCINDYEKVSDVIRSSLAIFLNRILESLNPLYWIDAIINLPKKALLYLGMSPESVFIKLFQIIWWITMPIFILYRDKLLGLVTTLP